MSPLALSAAESTGATGALAAAERMQRLQSMIAQVERGPAGFAAALHAAQADSAQAGNAQAGPAQTGPAQASATQADLAPGMTTAATTAGAPASSAYPPASLAGTNASGAYPPTSLAATSAATASQPNAAAAAYAPLIEQAAARNGVDPAVLYGLIEQESGFDPNATSSAGALGLTQLMPGTAASLGVTEPLNPEQSIEGGARYLGQMLRQFAGNTSDALAAYNAGPGAVQQYGGVPPYPETQQYVSKVLANAAAYPGAATATTAATGAPA
jgi:soluble lytic murein transglycosylase-like protein